MRELTFLNEPLRLFDIKTFDHDTNTEVKVNIKWVCCAYDKSFALTDNGQVFAWGSNKNCDLGLNVIYCNRKDSIYEPKRIHLYEYIVDVALNTRNT